MTTTGTRGAGPALESRPEELWRLIGPLHQRFDEGKRLAAVHVEALAEAYFRIGVHADTPPGTAVDVLARAHRLDPANPKHPYHLGLVHLRHGAPEQAVAWLTAAARLSPVNHRTRAHLSLAYRELAALRQGTENDAREYRTEAERIACGVRAGKDAFEPKKWPEEKKSKKNKQDDEQEDAEKKDGKASALADPVKALVRAGECRWSGIRDLEAEAGLGAKTTKKSGQELAMELEALAELAERRPGRAGAFTILAVQWLLDGYPAATIRRLVRQLPAADAPSSRLLELVCELFEVDFDLLPSRLAESLAERSLPDVLVALIHRQRLLWRMLSFPELDAHAAAREFTEGEPDRHVKDLESAWEKLSADPPKPMADVSAPTPDAPATAADLAAQLVIFEQAAEGYSQLRNDIITCIKAIGQQGVETAADYARASGDRRLLDDLAEDLERLRTDSLADLQQFQQQCSAHIGASEPGTGVNFTDFQSKLEKCQSAFQGPTPKLPKPLKRKIDKAKAEFGEIEPVATRQAMQLAAQLAALEQARQQTNPGTDTAASKSARQGGDRVRARPALPPTGASGRERVAHALAVAEQALDANFAEAWQSLAAYPPELRHRDALVLLRSYLGGRQAEAALRLGRPTEARQHWTSLLADDPVQPAVLHNLAVAHTSAGDPGPAAEAWERYIEAVYLRDLLHGALRRGAPARAELHRVLAASFGTAPLCTVLIPGDADEREEAERQIPPLLASRAKVALVAAHLRLEELNHTYARRNPVLLLGIDRADGDAAAARERRVGVLGAAVTGLPGRVRAAFEKECLAALDKACAEVSAEKGWVRRPGDEAELSAHAEWAQARVHWKNAILGAIAGKHADWALTEYSGAVIGNLRFIDELSLDPTDAILRDCLRQFSSNAEPEAVIKQLDNLSNSAVKFAFKQILEAAESAADSRAAAHRFAEQFQRVGRSWADNEVPEPALERLDDPLELYAETAEAALLIARGSETLVDEREREVVTGALPALEDWVERLPGATGPARSLARLLGALGRYDDALTVLARADTEAFSGLGRDKVVRARILLDVVRGEFASAVAQLRDKLGDRPDDEQLRGLLVRAYDRWIKSGDRLPDSQAVTLPDPEDITADFARWTDAETVSNRRILALNAALTRHKSADKGKAREDLLAYSLRALVTADPDNLDAQCHLSVTLHRLAWECRKEMQKTTGVARQQLRDTMRKVLEEFQDRTKKLLPRIKGEEHAEQREVLERILQEVRDALSGAAG